MKAPFSARDREAGVPGADGQLDRSGRGVTDGPHRHQGLALRAGRPSPGGEPSSSASSRRSCSSGSSRPGLTGVLDQPVELLAGEDGLDLVLGLDVEEPQDDPGAGAERRR